MEIPGGALMSQTEFKDTELEELQQQLLTLTNAYPYEAPYLYDEQFLRELRQVPNYETLVTESVKYIRGEKSDPNSVLVFRRTLPQIAGIKPEKYWCVEYLQVRNGLQQEIHGTHRENSRIYVSTIGILEDTTNQPISLGGLTDGELQISDQPLDLQKASLFSIKIG